MENTPLPTKLMDLRAAMRQAGIKDNLILALPPLVYAAEKAGDSTHPLEDSLITALPGLGSADHLSTFQLIVEGKLDTFLMFTNPARQKVFLRVDESQQVTACAEKDLLDAMRGALAAGVDGAPTIQSSQKITREDALALAALMDLQDGKTTAVSEKNISALPLELANDMNRPARLSIQMTTLLAGSSEPSDQVQASLERLQSAGLAERHEEGWLIASTISTPGMGGTVMASTAGLTRGMLQTADTLLVGSGADCLAFMVTSNEPGQVEVIRYAGFSAADYLAGLVKPETKQAVEPARPPAAAGSAASKWTTKTKIALAVAIVCLGIAACGCITTIVSLVW